MYSLLSKIDSRYYKIFGTKCNKNWNSILVFYISINDMTQCCNYATLGSFMKTIFKSKGKSVFIQRWNFSILIIRPRWFYFVFNVIFFLWSQCIFNSHIQKSWFCIYLTSHWIIRLVNQGAFHYTLHSKVHFIYIANVFYLEKQLYKVF